MAYTDDDSSVDDSRPVELFTFTSQRSVAPVVARSTSYHRDVVYGSNTYVARPIRRGAAATADASDNLDEMTVEVASLDPVAVYYMRLGVVPQNLRCRIDRLQLTSGTAVRIFEGLVTDARQSGRTVTFTLTQQLDDPLATKFPTIQISRRCQHVLYDSSCNAPRAASQITTTITAIGDWRTVTVASLLFGMFFLIPESDFLFGELLHVPSGERRSISYAVATRQITLDCRLPSNAVNGDAVTLWRGCDRSPQACRDKFGNIPNFGGNPHFATRRAVWTNVGILKTSDDT